jgi:hypothetical protein
MENKIIPPMQIHQIKLLPNKSKFVNFSVTEYTIDELMGAE